MFLVRSVKQFTVGVVRADYLLWKFAVVCTIIIDMYIALSGNGREKVADLGDELGESA